MFCPSCGTQFISEAVFCHSCGRQRPSIPLREPTNSEAAEPAATPALPPLPAQPKPLGVPLVGVSGWLRFFCFSLAVLTPALVIVDLAQNLDAAAKMPAASWWLIPFAWYRAALTMIIALLAVRAGVKLWRVEPRAVSVAKRYLVAQVPLALVAHIIALVAANVPEAASSAISRAEGGALFRNIFYNLCWLLYLRSSRRVRNTYSQSTDAVQTVEVHSAIAAPN